MTLGACLVGGTRAIVRLLAALMIVGFVLWLVIPALDGFHIGYNAMTDHECMNRILQWCK